MPPAALFTFSLLLMAEVPLPGTQPDDLEPHQKPAPSSSCGCHDAFDPTGIIEPGQSYRATPMALSARDPLFLAALEANHRARPELTDLCIRCHAPNGWLSGRSTPGDASLLNRDDIDSGVSCDMCHRMLATPSGPQLIGSGQYTLSSSTAKRASRGRGDFAPHDVVQSDFTASSSLCAPCHSLFNPEENAHDLSGTDLGITYYEQRTFEEWSDSIFNGTMSCIDCHMQRTRGAAARNGEEYDDLHVHDLVGGNLFLVEAVKVLDPDLEIDRELPVVKQWIARMLRSAADLEVLALKSNVDPEMPVVAGGEKFTLEVRLTNRTGHKLPTGYPEGRRVYLEVKLHLAGQEPMTLSGAWDAETGNLVRDSQIRTYETEHGRYEDGQSRPERLLIRMNQIRFDTRIPPEGFRPSYPDMIPSGRDYGATAPYRHYDDVTYEFTLPEIASAHTATITVRAMYQSTDGDVVQFLIDEAEGSQAAENLAIAWEMLGHAPPQPITTATATIQVVPDRGDPDPGHDGGIGVDISPEADSSVSIRDAAAAMDASAPMNGDEVDERSELDGGCSCRMTGRDRAAPHNLRRLALSACWLVGFLWFALTLTQPHGSSTSERSRKSLRRF